MALEDGEKDKIFFISEIFFGIWCMIFALTDKIGDLETQ